MARRGLEVFLTILGTVAVVSGTLTVFTGGSLVPDGAMVSPNLDSELRFHAAWYVAGGLIALRAARRVESEGTAVRLFCGALFLAGAGRVLSLITIGPPHPFFLALLALEFALPVIIVPWQASVARRAHRSLG